MLQPLRSPLLYLMQSVEARLQVRQISLPEGKTFFFFSPEIREEDQEPYELVFTVCQMHLIICPLQ